MNEEIKKIDEEILDDATLEQVAGGTQAEIESDLTAYAKMIGKNRKDVNMTKLMKAFDNSGVSTTFNGESEENIYEVNGSRVHVMKRWFVSHAVAVTRPSIPDRILEWKL